jgi:hypothetical protein
VVELELRRWHAPITTHRCFGLCEIDGGDDILLPPPERVRELFLILVWPYGEMSVKKRSLSCYRLEVSKIAAVQRQELFLAAVAKETLRVRQA